MKTLLQIENLSFSYPARMVFEEVSFEANAGEFIVLMGSNGAGKSTLLDTIAGLREPTSGTIKINGKSLRDWRANELARRVAHLPQSVRADLPFTVEQLVLMGRYPHSEAWFDSPADVGAARLAMQRTACWDDRSRRVFTLSGGERQRVLLAACLAQNGDVCLMDEPSVFLDIEQQLRCFDLLADEAHNGKLCIAVTHDLNLALRYCSRLLVLAEQKLLVDRSVRDARRNSDWLGFFSNRLQLGDTPNGKPWVWYR
ncbi:MAG TPA: ABC transporter ATP-binding protein [Candidatus Sulfotelmatobacter sp.]|jgi:iron complex transport system ATP-binding protein